MHHPNDVASTSMVDPCDICGDFGFGELIVTCSECKVNREHCYCTRVYLREVPEVWFCDPCESKNATTSPCQVNQDIGLPVPKKQQTARTGKVKFLNENEVIKLASGSLPMTRKVYVGPKNAVSKIPLPTVKSSPCISPTIQGKVQRNEAQKNQITDQYASHPSSKGPTKEHRQVSDRQVGALIRDRKVQFLDLHDEKPPKWPLRRASTARMSTPITGSGAVVKCDRSNIERSNIQSIPENFHYYHKHFPSSVSAWRGQFQILELVGSGKGFDGFEAQPPCVVNRKAHEISNKMPYVLQLEALPASNVLTDVFPNDPPSLHDVALYFFPSDRSKRSRENLNSVFEFLSAGKSMLRSLIDGVELLLFTSSQLNEESRGTFAAVYSEHFLWGVFRETKTDNTIERLPDLVDLVDMDIDMIGGKDVLERIDHVQNVKPNSVSQWSSEGTLLQKVKLENTEITPSNEHRKKVSFGISSKPPIWNPAKPKEYCKLFKIPEVPPGFEELGYDSVKPPKYKRLDELN